MKTVQFLLAFSRKAFLQEASYRTHLLFRWLSIAMLCLIYYHLSEIVDTADPRYRAEFGGGYFSFFIVGIALFRFTSQGLSSFSKAFRSEAVGGTLESLWLGRQSPQLLLLAMGTWPFLNGLVTLFGIILVGGILSPTLFQEIPFVALSLSTLLAFFLYSSFGIIAASITLVVKRGEAWIRLFGMLNFGLAGVFFPVSLLPPFLQRVSEWLPLTHLLRLAREGLPTQPAALLSEAGFLLLFVGVMYPLSFFCLKRAVLWAETEGSIAHF